MKFKLQYYFITSLCSYFHLKSIYIFLHILCLTSWSSWSGLKFGGWEIAGRWFLYPWIMVWTMIQEKPRRVIWSVDAIGPGELAPDYQSCLFISIWWFILVPLIMMRCVKIRNTIRTVHFQSNVSHYYYNLIVTVDFSDSNRNFNRWFRPH